MKRRRLTPRRPLPDRVSTISDAKPRSPKVRRYTQPNVDYQPTKDPEPTPYPPGSREKVNVLRGRAERNERLWHEFDAGFGAIG